MTVEIPIEVPSTPVIYRHLWRASIALGLIGAGVSAAVPALTTFVVGASLIIALLVGVFAGVMNCLRENAEDQEDQEENPLLFSSNLWLQLSQHIESPDQLDLFEKQTGDPQDRRKVHRFFSANRDMLVVRCDRFQEILVSRITDEADKATEHALMVAFRRVEGEASEKLRPLLNKAFREIVKADFRGSLITLLCRQAMKIEQELRTTAEAPTPAETGFSLVPIQPATPRPPAAPKPKRKPSKSTELF